MLSLISKIKSNIYARYKVDEHSQFYFTWVLVKCSENLVSYLEYFGAINEVYYIIYHYLIFLIIIFFDEDKKVLILA